MFPTLGIVFQIQWLLYLISLVKTKRYILSMCSWKESNSTQPGPI